MISPFRHKVGGFTLIELVVVIVLIGILAGTLFTVIRGPIESSIDVRQRAALVAKAETALQRMVREIRRALPNSVRLSGSNALEFLRTSDGGRYRARPRPSPGPPPGNPVLRFNNSNQGTNGTFEVLGGLLNIEAGTSLDTLAGAADETACLDGTTDCMVVYNTGQPGANAYDGDNVAAIQGYDGTNDAMTFIRSTGFPHESPQQRFQVVDTPVSYVCDGGNSNIRRYSEYGIQSTQPVPPTGGNDSLLVDNVSGCEFVYEPGAATRAGLLTFRITLNQGGQTVTLSQQAHVENLP